MIEETLVYYVGSQKYLARLYTQDKNKRPAVLVLPAWYGQDDFARNQAKKLAAQGYAGIALDMYGDGKKAENDEEAGNLMLPLFISRKELRKRIIGGFEAVRALEWIDVTRIGAMGFCFGGLCVIELLFSGAPIKGVVSFHAVLGTKRNNQEAMMEPDTEPKGAFLGLHGAEDPMGTWKDVIEFSQRLTDSKVDWEFDIYGHTKHAFTNPEMHDFKGGLAYDEKASHRAFNKMEQFFKEMFNS